MLISPHRNIPRFMTLHIYQQQANYVMNERNFYKFIIRLIVWKKYPDRFVTTEKDTVTMGDSITFSKMHVWINPIPLRTFGGWLQRRELDKGEQIPKINKSPERGSIGETDALEMSHLSLMIPQNVSSVVV